MAATAYWEALNHDLLVLIAKRIKLIEDFVCFGMVCKSWKEAALVTKLLHPQIPWLILATDNNQDDQDANRCGRGRRQIYNLPKEKVITTNNLYFPSERKCIALEYGWILTISNLDCDMNLVHPLSGSEIKLPNQTTLEECSDDKVWPSYEFTRAAALSGNPSESSLANFTLMIVHSGGGKLGYWRLGDRCWTSMSEATCCFYDLIYYKDQFYAISNSNIIWGCTITNPRHDHHQQPNIVLEKIDATISRDILPNEGGTSAYMVESPVSPNVLLLVVREEAGEYPDLDETEVAGLDEEGGKLYEDKDVNYWFVDFKVYEVDLINGGCPKKILDMGDTAIFVGHNTSISLVASQFVGIKPNHIYFTDDKDKFYSFMIRGGGTSMGCFCLEDSKVTKFNVGPSRSRINPPFWYIPSL